uniref:Hypotheticial protein n=2 Tax=Schistosoma japonicum TaxID=6182 RepID=C1L4I4_SCHJA|nr:hypotheticial protein [Schistosoma japonicum]
MLEVFLSSSFHAHLDSTHEFFRKASEVNQQMSDLLNTGQNELNALDNKMDEDMNSMYKLLHIKPEK